MDNFVNIELAKRMQRENKLESNSQNLQKAFDIEMEEFSMVEDHFNDHNKPKSFLQNAAANTLMNPSMMLPLFWLASSEPAMAQNGQFGPMECLPLSLAHPLIMFGLLMASLFAADAGWKWR